MPAHETLLHGSLHAQGSQTSAPSHSACKQQQTVLVCACALHHYHVPCPPHASLHVLSVFCVKAVVYAFSPALSACTSSTSL